jgi:hypothetical protein
MHGFDVSMTGAAPCAQSPAPSHVYAPTQRLLLLAHAVPAGMGAYVTPVVGLHAPTTQGFDVLMTGGEPWTHAPLPSQRSAPAQRFVLLPQAVPAVCAGLEHVPVEALHVPATWQASSAVHVTAVPEHAPLEHWSIVVQGLPSLHAVPFVAAGLVQVPDVGSQTPAAWHWSDAAHVTVLPAEQLPFWQVSFRSQALPSLQAVPFAAAGLEHAPVAGLHVPALWHWSEAEHVTGLPPAQTPDWHASLCVQALPSLHDVPLVATGFVHAPVVGLQVPAAWHGSDAAHVAVAPGVHTPTWQVSFESHLLPSLQLVPSGNR